MSQQMNLMEEEKDAMQLASTASQIVAIDKLAREKIEAANKARESRFADVKRQKEQMQAAKRQQLEQDLKRYARELAQKQSAAEAQAKAKEQRSAEAFEAAFSRQKEKLTEHIFQDAIQFEKEF